MHFQKIKHGYKLVETLFEKLEIPESWSIQPLGSLATLFVPMRDKPKKFGGTIPWLRIEDLDGKYVNESKSGQKVTHDTVKEMKLRVYPKGTILCSCSATLGVCALTTGELITNQTFIGIHPSSELDNEFLYYFMSTQSRNLIRISSGTTIPYISRKKFEQLSIIFPPKRKEQQKIASILSNIDNAIQNVDQIIKQTERLKKGMMQKLLVKGIGHTKFKKIRYLFKDFFIEIPDEWKPKKLIDVCTEKPQYGAGASAIEKDEKLARYIRITDLNYDGTLRDDEWKSITDDNAKSFYLQEGDFLFARTGATVGKTYLYKKEHGKCAFAGYLIKFVPNKELLLPEFLFYYTQSFRYRQWLTYIQTWGVQPNINASLYSSMPIFIPTINEQKQIILILFDIDSKIQNQMTKKSTLRLLKKELMENLLTGKIRTIC